MATLPTSGSAYNSWGDQLNEWLQVSHNPDGTLRATAPVAYLVPPLIADFVDFGVIHADNSPILQSALDAAAAYGAAIHIPAGQYGFDGPVTGYPNVDIQGEGQLSTKLNYTAASSTFLTLTASGDFPCRAKWSDFSLVGNALGADAIEVGNTLDGAPLYGFSIERVYVTDFSGTAFYFHGCFMLSVRHCEAWNNGGYGFYFDGGTVGDTPTGTWQTSTHIDTCYANGNGNVGFNFKKATYFVLSACAADNNAVGYSMEDVSCLVFNGCGAESPDTPEAQAERGTQSTGFYVLGSDTVGSSDITFNGCYVYANTSYAWDFSSNAINCVMNGCRELTPAGIDPITAGVRVATGCYVTMISCTIPDGVANEAGSKILMLAAANGAGNPEGLSAGPDTPQLYPNADSLQAISRDPATVPMVFRGAPGQTASLAKFTDSDSTTYVTVEPQGQGQLTFGGDSGVTLERPTGAAYLKTPQPFSVAHAASVSALNTSFPPADYPYCIATVDTDKGLRLVFSDGVHWLTSHLPGSGYAQPVQQDGTY